MLDIWFAPKHFESTALYERLGVLFVKRYVPTGGDFFRHRYGIRIVEIRGKLDSLIQFERCTRKLEAIHVTAFLAFLASSLWRAIIRQTTVMDFGIAILVYTTLILSPAMLQRYNRLRVNAAIRRLTARGLRSRHGSQNYGRLRPFHSFRNWRMIATAGWHFEKTSVLHSVVDCSPPSLRSRYYPTPSQRAVPEQGAVVLDLDRG